MMIAGKETPRVDRDSAGVQELVSRLSRARFPVDVGAGWEAGVPVAWLQELVAEWQAHDYDALQATLDALPHVSAEIDGVRVHAIARAGAGRDPVPLMLLHGWPSSVLEYVGLLPLLTAPSDHGAAGGVSFSVVIPCLPGFPLSGPPPATGLTSREVARRMHELMVDVLGYGRYAVHGGDLGAGGAAWLGRQYPENVIGVHLATPGLAVRGPSVSTDEATFAAEVDEWSAREGGYAHEQQTKPYTLAAGLSDSPRGLASWIAEKWSSWSPARADGSPAFPRALLLDTLTLYWCCNSAATSLLPYWAARHSRESSLPIDDPTPVSTVISLFGGERVPFPKPPRSLAERYFRVTGWQEYSIGGHFPAIAEPALLVDALRSAFGGSQ
jgi:pimeloyl-ACP methyl ester carboxylesterase